MADPNASQTTLRDTLSAQFDAASEGAADTSAVIQQAAPSTETTEQAAQRARDEQGAALV